ncbi:MULTISPECIES: hypothetical protein [Amycolatopsis]|uniref:Uncharacterized protein n=1 Tax=Amycolatopsis dongchuanensis TaxID=1070866 RepID=A0ABP8VTY7_9PSEU
MDLKTAIQKITDEYVVPEGQTADPGEVTWEARGALTVDELDSWQGKVAPDVIEAYRTVLGASADDVTRALR